MRFIYSNIEYKKHPEEDSIIVTGEITNDAGKHYNTVVFRMILFIRAIPVANVNFVVRNFYANQTKPFEVRVPELSYKLISRISRCEIYPESAY
jgi:hypothetical protein